MRHVAMFSAMRNLRSYVSKTRQWPMFRVCGHAGLLLAFVQSSILVHRLGLSQPLLLGTTGIAILTFLALAMITKIVVGRELLIYYHHEIAVIATTALFLRLADQPVLPYLDITVLGIGLFLSCGRLGCLMVGCCHGRPWSWGITYSEEHAQAGFPSYLVGVRLFPIQAVESLFALGLVVSGLATIINGYPPGTALALYLLLYALGRFCFEFARGDAVRPYFWGFSEAQWTSLAVAIGEVCAAYANLIPRYRWHSAVPLILLASPLLIGLKRLWARTSRYDLLHPRHIRELAEALVVACGAKASAGANLLLPTPGAQVIHLAQTSLGVRLTSGDIFQGRRKIRHYTLSNQAGCLSVDSARLLGILIARLHHNGNHFELLPANSGVYHLLFETHNRQLTNTKSQL